MECLPCGKSALDRHALQNDISHLLKAFEAVNVMFIPHSHLALKVTSFLTELTLSSSLLTIVSLGGLPIVCCFVEKVPYGLGPFRCSTGAGSMLVHACYL